MVKDSRKNSSWGSYTCKKNSYRNISWMMRNEKTVVEEWVAWDLADKNLKDDSHVKWFIVLNVVR